MHQASKIQLLFPRHAASAVQTQTSHVYCNFPVAVNLAYKPLCSTHGLAADSLQQHSQYQQPGWLYNHEQQFSRPCESLQMQRTCIPVCTHCTTCIGYCRNTQPYTLTSFLLASLATDIRSCTHVQQHRHFSCCVRTQS